MNFPKILICCPTSDYKDYCLKEWAENVKKFTYPNFDVLMVDNSNSPKYHKKIIELGINCLHYTPKENETTRQYITHCQNMMLDYFLANPEYKFMFSLESDIFPPLNCIELLLRHKKQVVGFPYFIGHSVESKMLLFRAEDFGASRQIFRLTDLECYNYCDGTLKATENNGIGCLLIHRSVFESGVIRRFRIDEENDETHSHSDTFIHEDLRKGGIVGYVDTSVIVHHQNTGWFELQKLNKI